MNFIVALYFSILFFMLTPGIFFTVYKKGSFRLIAFIHSLLFAIIMFFTFDFINSYFNKKKEGFSIKGSVSGTPSLQSGITGSISINDKTIPVSFLRDPSNPQGIIFNVDDSALVAFQKSITPNSPLNMTPNIRDSRNNALNIQVSKR